MLKRAVGTTANMSARLDLRRAGICVVVETSDVSVSAVIRPATMPCVEQVSQNETLETDPGST